MFWWKGQLGLALYHLIILIGDHLCGFEFYLKTLSNPFPDCRGSGTCRFLGLEDNCNIAMGYGWVGRHIIRSFDSAKGFRIWDCIKFPFYFLILCSFIVLGFRFCVWREKTKSLSNFQKASNFIFCLFFLLFVIFFCLFVQHLLKIQWRIISFSD